MNRHLDLDTLRRLVSGDLPLEDVRHADRHLVECAECQVRVDEASSMLTLRLLDEAVLTAGYDEAFERAASRAARTLAGIMEEARSAEALLGDLLREPGPMRRRRIRSEERFQIFELSQLFRLRSRDARFSDSSKALEMADLAVEVAQHLDSGKYGLSFAEGARALAWAWLANAWRLNSDLWRAEAAMRQAWIHHGQSGQDTYIETELLTLTASLRGHQGLYEEALQLCDRSITIFREVCDHHLEGIAQLQKGSFLGGQGRHLEAIPMLRVGLRRIDPSLDPHLVLEGKHNLIGSMTQVDPPEQAERLLEENRSLYEDVGYPTDQIRFRWLEAEIARARGELAKTETVLWEVRESFLDRRMGIDAFFASLELAEVCTMAGKRQHVREVLEEAIPLGEAMGLRREALAARLLYERAAQG